MENNKIITHKFELEIAVNIDDIQHKYPNYRFNFNKVEDFVHFIVNDLKHSGDIDLSKEAMEKFGYSVNIKQKN